VITWADAHTRAAAMAAELHADLDIDLNQPVDVFAAVKRLGLVLAFAPLGRVSGLYLPEGHSPGILLHEGHPRTRQRYTAGHELGHHVFGHAAEVDFELEDSLRRGEGERWPDHEKEAEAFGAWFLMPRRLLRRGLKRLGVDGPRDPYDVYALSLWLGTSYTATARQLSATRLVDYQVAERWARIPPRDVKRALAGELVPDDLHNDVWWLDARHNRQPVEARPGDRLVLTLEEIPSSGFSWRLTTAPGEIQLLADSYQDSWEPELTEGAEAIDRAGEGAEELVGGDHPRSLVLEIDPQAERAVHHLALVKDQPWDPGPPSDEFELLVSVNPPLHGIQMPESELALSGGGPTAA
jgi:Zn-dependent peptidase ImmA (M78 family)